MLLTTTRRILGPGMLTPIKITTRQVRNFKGVRHFIKCNAYIENPERKPVIRYRKGNYRKICQSSYKFQSKIPESGMNHMLMDELRLNGGFVAPIAKFPTCSAITTPIGPFVSNWKWYAKTEDTKQPIAKEPVKEPSGVSEKADETNEDGLQTRKSRLEQIKQMLKDKSMLRGTDNAGRKT